MNENLDKASSIKNRTFALNLVKQFNKVSDGFIQKSEDGKRFEGTIRKGIDT
jgi:hypothetical protein